MQAEANLNAQAFFLPHFDLGFSPCRNHLRHRHVTCF